MTDKTIPPTRELNAQERHFIDEEVGAMVRFVHINFDLDLAPGPQLPARLEYLVDQLREERRANPGQISEQFTAEIMIKLGFVLGEHVVATSGGVWHADDLARQLCVKLPNRRVTYPVGKLARRLDDADVSIVGYCEAIRRDLVAFREGLAGDGAAE